MAMGRSTGGSPMAPSSSAPARRRCGVSIQSSTAARAALSPPAVGGSGLSSLRAERGRGTALVLCCAPAPRVNFWVRPARFNFWFDGEAKDTRRWNANRCPRNTPHLKDEAMNHDSFLKSAQKYEQDPAIFATVLNYANEIAAIGVCAFAREENEKHEIDRIFSNTMSMNIAH